MKSNHMKLTALALVGVLSMFAAGCGKDEPTVTTTRPPATTLPATTPATTPPTTTPATTPPTTPPATTPPPVPAITKTYALPGNQVFPEGVAWDPTSNDFFTGSTNDGTIYRGDIDSGQVTVFSAAGADGRTAAIGMKVDVAKRRLWVCGGATGSVWVYDVNSGALIRKFDTPQVASTFLNDVALAPNGDVYVTDSRRPVLFKITGSGAQPGQLEDFIEFENTPIVYTAGVNALNGIVVTADGANLIVVHSGAQKLYRIAVATKTITEINLGGALQGGDGMVLDGQILYICERVTNTDRIVRVRLAADFDSGTIVDNFRDSTFSTPTTIAKVGNRMLVVNSQFANRGTGLTPTLPFTITDMPIPPLP
jgi:sugar lactone lactonase YvrE